MKVLLCADQMDRKGVKNQGTLLKAIYHIQQLKSDAMLFVCFIENKLFTEFINQFTQIRSLKRAFTFQNLNP